MQPVLVRSISQSPSLQSSVYCAAGEAVVIGIGGLMPALETEVGVCLCVFWGEVYVCLCVRIWILTLIWIYMHFPPL